MPVPTKLKEQMAASSVGKKRREPLWKGPCVDGVTQSMLSRFLCCRERFRVLVIEGLRPKEGFNPRTGFGDLWHLCEEQHAKGESWQDALKAYATALAKKYPTQGADVSKSYEMCKCQFPIYQAYWSKQKDVKARKPILQEYVFKTPYQLPSGRVVLLRGKFDSVDLIDGGVWLQENKTKGDIDEDAMLAQLKSGFDLQTMLYLTALSQTQEQREPPFEKDIGPIMGVRYNVIRRPLAGGRHSIRQHQPTKANPGGESLAAFYERLGGLIREDAPYFFMRWTVNITDADLSKFQRECLTPVLEQLCDWYQVVADDGKAKVWSGAQSLHFRFPYGIYNPMLEGRSSEVDEYLNTGSEVGLERVEKLMGELG